MNILNLMRKLFFLTLFVFQVTLFTKEVLAHPIDEIGDIRTYDQKQILEIKKGEARLTIDLTFYALDKVKVWESIDRNRDRQLSVDEKNEWMRKGQEASFLEINEDKVSFEAITLNFPDYFTFFSEKPANVKIVFLVKKEINSNQKIIYNYLGKDKKLSEIEFSVKGVSDLRVNSLNKESDNQISFSVEEGKGSESVLAFSSSSKIDDFLNKYIKSQNLPLKLVIFALFTSFILGALHALTPGHGKTIVASYLVGEKGTIIHAINLGLIVTVTHTASVFILGLVALFLTEYFVPSAVIRGLSFTSGLLVLIFGLVLFIQRMSKLVKKHSHSEEHEHKIRDLSWKNLLALGVSGGIVPCIDALAILIVAISIQKIAFGLSILIAFSLGLASALILAGIIAVSVKNTILSKFSKLHAYEHILGIASAVVVTFLGLVLVLNSVKDVYAGGTFASNIFVQTVQTESRAVIIYDGKREVLFDSVTFNINPVIAWNFAWIIAVPGKPKVDFVLDDILTRLEVASEKKLFKNSLLKKLIYFDVDEEKVLPESLYTRSLDFINYQIFAPENSVAELEKHLSDFGYYIPKDGNRLINDYHEKGWYFIVAEINANHLQMDASESLTVPGAHTYPLKIEFDTDRIIYPLKLAKIQPDYDSKSVSLSYEYNLTSEQVLGVKDERVDDMLSYQSKNEYPRLPYDYGYQKIELFVVSDHKVESENFVTTYANWIDSSSIDFTALTKDKYFELPKKRMFLTRLFAFKPMIQLEDIYLKNASDNRRVNPLISTKENLVRIFTALAVLLIVGYFIRRRVFRNE